MHFLCLRCIGDGLFLHQTFDCTKLHTYNIIVWLPGVLDDAQTLRKVAALTKWSVVPSAAASSLPPLDSAVD